MKTNKLGEVISSNVRTSGTGVDEGKSFTFMRDPVCPVNSVEVRHSLPEEEEAPFTLDQKCIALNIIFKGLP